MKPSALQVALAGAELATNSILPLCQWQLIIKPWQRESYSELPLTDGALLAVNERAGLQGWCKKPVRVEQVVASASPKFLFPQLSRLVRSRSYSVPRSLFGVVAAPSCWHAAAHLAFSRCEQLS